MFAILFDLFVDNYDASNFNLESDSYLKELNFDQKSEYFRYFFKNLSDLVKAANYNLDSAVIQTNTGLAIFLEDYDTKFGKMVQFYFDENLFRLLRGEVGSAPDFENNSELRLIDILESATQANLIGDILKELSDALNFKIQQLFLNTNKFFIWFLRNSNSSLHNLKKKVAIKNLIVFSDCSNLKLTEVYSNFLAKSLLILIHKFGITLKIAESFREPLLKRFAKEFFGQLKIQCEELFADKIVEGNKLQGDATVVCNEIKQILNFGLPHFFTLIMKLDNPLRTVMETFATFIEIPRQIQIFTDEYLAFQNSLFSNFISRIRAMVDRSFDLNKGPNEMRKLEIINNAQEESFDIQGKPNLTQASNLINRSFEQPPIYFSGFINKRCVLEKVVKVENFMNDLHLILNSGLAQNSFVQTSTIALYNYNTLKLIQFYRENFAGDIIFRKVTNLKKPENWQIICMAFEQYLLHFDEIPETSEEFDAEKDTSIDEPGSKRKIKNFDFTNIDVEDFWKIQKRIEFYENTLILFGQVFSIYSMYHHTVQKIWSSQEDESFHKVQKILGIDLELSEPFEDFAKIYQTVKAKKLDDTLISRIFGKVNLTNEENLIAMVTFCFELKSMLMDMFFFLKYHFDFMVSFFFKENMETLSVIDIKDRQFFNTASQINDVRNYLMSFDNLTKNYLTHGKLKKFFIMNTIETYFDNLYAFIFEIKEVFFSKKDYLNAYNKALVNLLLDMQLMKGAEKEIQKNAKTFKKVKKVIYATNLQELEELVQDFGLDPDSREVQLAKNTFINPKKTK